jgi:hypothetical protein
MISRRHDRVARAAVVALCAVLVGTAAADDLQPDHVRRRVTGQAFLVPQLQVSTGGNEQAARQYYRNIVAPQMKFATQDTIESTSIKDLLTYFGYSGLDARDLHQLPSDQLMALGADGDILATRFFAPKITQVSTPPDTVPRSGYGWRKLVRFRAKAGSSAEANGMELLYFLQNTFERSTPPSDPFDADRNVSLFNQAIATRKPGSGPYNSTKPASYFFAYSPLVKCGANGVAVSCEPGTVPLKVNGLFENDGAIAFKLAATFDARKHPETGAAADDYFVPISCVQCHGGVRTNGKLNFLDTDHWFDRVTPTYGLADPKFAQEDFTALSQSPYGVFYDGGTDLTTEKFKGAFAAIRRVNEEIRAQNTDVAVEPAIGAPTNFQLRAVSKWLDLHAPVTADPVRHVPPYERGLGANPWDPANNDHRILLYYFNRYCYRCHSSIKYSVFDRGAVKDEMATSEIQNRVLELNTDYYWMPQDRIFPGLGQKGGVADASGDLKQFLDLLKQLQ